MCCRGCRKQPWTFSASRLAGETAAAGAAMLSNVTPTAHPSDLKRLIVIVVVGLCFLRTALAWLTGEVAVSDGGSRCGSCLYFSPELWIGRVPVPHVRSHVLPLPFW